MDRHQLFIKREMKLDLQKILRELKPYRERAATVDPKHAFLLVIDMQNYFVQIARPVLGNILNVIQSCHQKKIPIIFTQHGHKDPVQDGGELREWWGQVILEGTEDWKFLPEIPFGPKDTVLPKKHYSAFLETNLAYILQSKKVREVIIAGVMTNLCCETTARDAFMRGYRIFFLIDGTSTGRSEHHLATLKNLGFGFAFLITCNELIQNLKSK
jgi:nicotinamidase-related amidase